MVYIHFNHFYLGGLVASCGRMANTDVTSMMSHVNTFCETIA